MDGKIIKRKFIVKGLRAKVCMEIVYTDMFGPFSVHARKVWVLHHLLTNTLGSDMCTWYIRSPILWIHLLNIRQN